MSGHPPGRRPNLPAARNGRRKADPIGRCRVPASHSPQGAITVTPAAHHIEALERESRRIDFSVAGSASWVGPMTIELLADRDRASDIRFESGHAPRWRGVEPEDAFHDPDA